MVRRPLSEIANLDLADASLLLKHDPYICLPSGRKINKTARDELRLKIFGDPRGRSAVTPEVTPADIGFGFMATAPSAEVASALTAEAACLRGELLACAMLTWMRRLSGSAMAAVDSVALYDCTVICQQASLKAAHERAASQQAGLYYSPAPEPDCAANTDHIMLSRSTESSSGGVRRQHRRNSSSSGRRHAPFAYVPPPWLTPHAVFHSHRGHHSEHHSEHHSGSASAQQHGGQHASSSAPSGRGSSAGSSVRIFPRCFWGRIEAYDRLNRQVLAQRDGHNLAHHNWAKGASLFSAMLEILPQKKLYIKLDLDTLILPHVLMRLLRGLDDAVGAESPLYFGNGYNLIQYYKEPWVVKGNPRGSPTLNDGKLYRAPLRATTAWRRLYHEIGREIGVPWETREGQRVQQSTFGVPYAAGGFEGFSRSSLSSLVSTECMERVAALTAQELTCPRVALLNSTRYRADVEAGRGVEEEPFLNVSWDDGPHHDRAGLYKLQPPPQDGEVARCEWASDFEDSGLGLCMHLLNVRMLQCTCLTQMTFLPAIPCECSRSRISQGVIGPHRARCDPILLNKTIEPGAVSIDATDGTTRLLSSNKSAAKLIIRKTCDTAYMNYSRCHTPVSLHPAKTPMQMLAWWTFYQSADSVF